MFGLNGSTVRPALIGTAAISLRDSPSTVPKWPPKYTRCPFAEKAMVNTRGAHRGGQAKPETWPITGAQLVTGEDAERPTDAMRCLTAPWMRLKSPPTKSLPFGPRRRANTAAFAPGFHAATAPVLVSAAR